MTTCPVCNAPIDGRSNKIYCSLKCREAQARKLQSPAKKIHMKFCLVCGEPLVGAGRTKYCSDKCRVSGENKRWERHRLAIKLNIEHPDKDIYEVRQMVQEQIP